MSATYDGDVVVWANKQAALIRARKFHLVDIEHVADEIEDVGKSEARELASRMAALVASPLKWATQPYRRGRGWRGIIALQRKAIARRMGKTPSLWPEVGDPEWQWLVWGDGVIAAARETGLDDLPFEPPWTVGQILDLNFLPDEVG